MRMFVFPAIAFWLVLVGLVPSTHSADKEPYHAHAAAAEQAWFEKDYVAAEKHWASAAALLAERKDKQEEYANVLNSLGMMQHQLKRYRESEESLRESLRILQAVFGPTHPKVRLPAYNLAQLLSNLGRYREAEALYLTVWRTVPERAEDKRADTLYWLGIVYAEAGRGDDAAHCYRRAIELFWKFGYNERRMEFCYRAFAELCARAGAPDKAKQAIDAIRTLDPKADVGWQEGLYHLANGAPAEAERVLASRFEKLRKDTAPPPERVGLICAVMGEVKVRRGDAATGKKLLDEAAAGYEKAFSPTHPKVARVLETYARLFPADGKEYAARAAKIRAENKDQEPRGLKAVFGDLP